MYCSRDCKFENTRAIGTLTLSDCLSFAAAVEIGVSLNSVFRCLLENPNKCAKLVDELRSEPNQSHNSEYL